MGCCGVYLVVWSVLYPKRAMAKANALLFCFGSNMPRGNHFLIKSLRAGEQPSEFADFKDSKTRDISPTMPDSV